MRSREELDKELQELGPCWVAPSVTQSQIREICLDIRDMMCVPIEPETVVIRGGNYTPFSDPIVTSELYPLQVWVGDVQVFWESRPSTLCGFDIRMTDNDSSTE